MESNKTKIGVYLDYTEEINETVKASVSIDEYIFGGFEVNTTTGEWDNPLFKAKTDAAKKILKDLFENALTNGTRQYSILIPNNLRINIDAEPLTLAVFSVLLSFIIGKYKFDVSHWLKGQQDGSFTELYNPKAKGLLGADKTPLWSKMIKACEIKDNGEIKRYYEESMRFQNMNAFSTDEESQGFGIFGLSADEKSQSFERLLTTIRDDIALPSKEELISRQAVLDILEGASNYLGCYDMMQDLIHRIKALPIKGTALVRADMKKGNNK